MKFLGQILSDVGVEPDPERVAAIVKLREPENASDVRRFLGMVNQLSKFTSNLAEKTKPLCDLLAKKNIFQWGLDQKRAFESMANTVFPQSNAAATIFFTLQAPAATIRGRRQFKSS